MSGQISIRLLTQEERDAETGWDEGDLVYVIGSGLSYYSGDSWGVVGAGGGGETTRVVLTDAQIRSLTTGIEIVPTPGPGMMLMPLAALLVADTTEAAYGNVGSNSGLYLGYSTTLTPPYILGSLSEASSGVSNLLTAQDKVLTWFDMTQAGASESYPYADPASNYDDKPLVLLLDNSGTTGELDGGDSANTLAVTVWHSTVAL